METELWDGDGGRGTNSGSMLPPWGSDYSILQGSSADTYCQKTDDQPDGNAHACSCIIVMEMVRQRAVVSIRPIPRL